MMLASFNAKKRKRLLTQDLGEHGAAYKRHGRVIFDEVIPLSMRFSFGVDAFLS